MATAHLSYPSMMLSSKILIALAAEFVNFDPAKPQEERIA
jgi:hypothetical protein